MNTRGARSVVPTFRSVLKHFRTIPTFRTPRKVWQPQLLRCHQKSKVASPHFRTIPTFRKPRKVGQPQLLRCRLESKLEQPPISGQYPPFENHERWGSLSYYSAHRNQRWPAPISRQYPPFENHERWGSLSYYGAHRNQRWPVPGLSYYGADRNQKLASPLVAAFADLQHGQEGLLGDIDAANTLHAFLAFFLLFEQLTLARDVAPVALGQNVLTHGGDGFAGDHLGPDRRLDCDLKHLAWDQFLHLRRQRAAAVVGEVAVDDERKGVHGIARDQDVELHHRRFP